MFSLIHTHTHMKVEVKLVDKSDRKEVKEQEKRREKTGDVQRDYA